MNTRHLFRVCLLLLLSAPLILSSCSDKVGTPTGPTSGTGMISGTVLDSVTHAPIAGALVSLWTAADTVLRDSIRADFNGHFTLGSITPSSYYLVIDSGDYNTYVERLDIQAGANLQRTIYLSHYASTSNQTSIAFHVESAVTGQPITTATIAPNGASPGTQVDNSGNATWYFASAELASFAIEAPGYSPVTTSVNLIQDQELFDTIYLSPHVDTLLAEYNFSGSAIDSSGKGHDGTLHGGTFVADRFGNANSALQLNGTSDYISIPNASDFNFGKSENFSICFWGKFLFPQYEGSGGVYLVRKGTGSENTLTGYEVLNTGYYMLADIGSTYGYGASEQEPGGGDTRWHFFAFTFDRSGTISYYYDGGPSTFGVTSIGTAMQGNVNTTAPLLIGGDGTAQHSFKGTLDDIRIYQGTLSATDVDSLYHVEGW
ncbi:MAG TPA: carboxypeptidase regulatory-like domain-containing protein [Candidatus Kapabacteria bacterium]|nr:carboxypeptidase regulatory-like domain-containing protein [Candidatus Kapabacteria bacterium]